MADQKPNNELKEAKTSEDLSPLDEQILDQIQKSKMPKKPRMK